MWNHKVCNIVIIKVVKGPRQRRLRRGPVRLHKEKERSRQKTITLTMRRHERIRLGAYEVYGVSANVQLVVGKCSLCKIARTQGPPPSRCKTCIIQPRQVIRCCTIRAFFLPFIFYFWHTTVVVLQPPKKLYGRVVRISTDGPEQSSDCWATT